MSGASISVAKSYLLPSSVATKGALSSLLTELERIDNEMTARAVHESDNMPEVEIPDAVQDFLSLNEFSLDNTNDRSELITQLRMLKRQAPVIHMKFAVETDSASLGTIVSWLRESVHPQAILVTGFQPSLVAGVCVRTPNHIYDMSLRSAFKQGREVLLEKLESLRGNE